MANLLCTFRACYHVYVIVYAHIYGESLMQQTAHLNEQIRFISFIQSHGMPSIVSEGDEDGMTYVEYIANLREEWKTGDETYK